MELKVHQKCLAIAVAASIAVGAGAFAGGMAYGRSSAAPAKNRAFVPNAGSFPQGGFGANAGGRTAPDRDSAAGKRADGRLMGGSVVGEVLKMDDQSVTVKLADGGTRLVFLSDKTQIMKTETGSTSDLTQGATVRVMGSSNQDGSVTAQNIQIVPAGQERLAPQLPAEAPVK